MSIDLSSLSSPNLDWLASAGWLHKGDPKTPTSSLTDLIALTERIFGGPCKVTVEMDPEIEDLQSLVFEATTSLDSKEIAARRREWHREVRQLVRDAHNLRLIFDVRR